MHRERERVIKCEHVFLCLSICYDTLWGGNVKSHADRAAIAKNENNNSMKCKKQYERQQKRKHENEHKINTL